MNTLIKYLGIIAATVICGVIAEHFDIWNEMIMCWIINVYMEIVWREVFR